MQYVLYRYRLDKYITYSETGKVIYTNLLDEAFKFESPRQAREARRKASKKINHYHVFEIMEDNSIKRIHSKNNKRKLFTENQRKEIYKKTNGHCYLCGDFVDFNAFEVEHKIPLGKGGTNDFENLFPSCHCCNTIKHDIYPEDFMERISKIFMYQIEKKNSGKMKWKIVHRLLVKLV